MATPASGAAKSMRRPSAAARLDIMELFARYSWSYDCSDAVGAAACFAEDAVIEAFGKETARGREAIVRFIAGLYESVRGDLVWQHHNEHFIFDGDDEACTVYCYTTILEQDPETQEYSVYNFGFYRTECRNFDGEWLITRRSINRWNRDRLPWAGLRPKSNGAASRRPA